MATYYVSKSTGNDGNAGTTGSPWKTIAKAIASVTAGDTVRIRAGKYYESVALTTPAKHSNTTWKADDPNDRPMIDGGYNISAMTGSGLNVRLPVSSTPTSILFSIGEGVINVVVDGLIIQNSPGAGMVCNGHNATVQNCAIYFTYWNGLFVNPSGAGRVNGLTVKNTRILKTSVRHLADNSQGSASVILRELYAPVLFQDVEIAYGHGESLDIDKPSTGTETQKFVFERMRIHDSNHTTLYFNQCRYVIWRDSVCYYSHQGSELHGGSDADHGYTCRIKDETNEFPNSKAGYIDIYNSLFINGGGLFIVGGGNRWTATRALYVGGNTFVGGNWTKNLPVKIESNNGMRNEGLFENNIIDLTAASGYNADVGRTTGSVNFLYRNNLWSHTPHTTMRSANSIYATPRLVNPGAVISTSNYFTAAMDSYEKVTTTDNFNANNYKLQANSPAIGAGSTGGAATNTNPPTPVPTRVRQIDRAGTNRGAVPDIGAYEYQSGGVTPPDPPTLVAAFTRTPTSGNAPLTVTYTDTSTTAGGASITSRLWEFGDGTTSAATNPSKTYATAGTYTTTLTITDSVNGLTSTFTGGAVTVTTVVTGSVSAQFTRTPATGVTGVTLFSFTDTSTETGDGNIDTWEWAFRDGSTSALQNPTHTYATAGTYRPRLTVRDSVRGYSSTWTGPDTVISEVTPDPTIEASFTPSVTSGQAPLTVTFTDTSQEAGGAAIDGWAWDFGDGNTSTTQSPVHVYQAAGTYQPQLTVTDSANGLLDVSVGNSIAVTAPPPPPSGGDVVLRQVRTAINTSSGNQTFTAAGLGGITPKSARFIVTNATADGTAADAERFGYGAAAGGAQWAAAVAAEHGAANTNAARMWTDDACLLMISADGAEVFRATFVSWTADGVTVDIDWTAAPAAYLVTVVFGAGTEYEAWVGTAALGAVGSTTNISTGFAPDVVRGVATWGSRETAAADLALSLGLAHRLGGQYVVERYYADGLADADNRLRLFDGQLLHNRYNTASRAGVSVSTWAGTSVTLLVSDAAINSTGLIMAEKFGDVGSQLALVDSAITTGNTDYALDWDPQYVEHLLSQATSLASVNDNQKAGTIGIHTVTDDGEFSNMVSGENGSATTNEQSLSDNQFIIVGHTGTTVAAGATTLGTAKYSINYATAPGTALKLPSLAVEEGQATGGGGDYVTAEFEANVTSGTVPLTVQFTDLSDGTNALTDWLWEFGDGASSTVRNPTHTYTTGGEYTVSLTVSDGTIQNTKTRSGYILAVEAAKREIIVGPYLLRVITELSTPVTHRDPTDEENGGYMEGGLALAALRLNADPNIPDPQTGDVMIYMDVTSGDAKVLRSDATTGTVDVT